MKIPSHSAKAQCRKRTLHRDSRYTSEQALFDYLEAEKRSV